MTRKQDSTLETFLMILPGFSKIIALFGALAIVIWGILPATIGVSKQLEGYTPPNSDLVRDYNPVYGNKDSKITVLEFLDFQCPGCKSVHPVIQQINEEYKNEVRFVTKMFPLPIHANAQISAESAMAAAKQGKFFEFGDKLFAYQDNPGLSPRTQEQIATELGLDMVKWNADRKSDEITKQIQWDQQDGRNAVLPVSEGSTTTTSIDSTPSFVFIKDGKILYKTNGMSADEFRTKLDALLGRPAKTETPTPSN